MKPFLFKQDRLLKLRKQQVRLSELHVAKASRDVAATKKLIEKLTIRIVELDQQLHVCTGPSNLQVHQVTISTRSQLESSRVVLAEQKQQLSSMVASLNAAIRSVDMLSTLEDRQQKKHTRDRQAVEQESIDSVSLRKWLPKGGTDV